MATDGDKGGDKLSDLDDLELEQIEPSTADPDSEKDVEQYGKRNSINFQIEMHFDGVIRLTLLGIDAGMVGNGITGISAGNGQPPQSYTGSRPDAYMSCNTACAGDFNADGNMDELDRAVFDAEFERIDCGQAEPCQADFDADGDVDEYDWEVFEINFGRTDCPI